MAQVKIQWRGLSESSSQSVTGILFAHPQQCNQMVSTSHVEQCVCKIQFYLHFSVTTQLHPDTFPWPPTSLLGLPFLICQGSAFKWSHSFNSLSTGLSRFAASASWGVFSKHTSHLWLHEYYLMRIFVTMQLLLWREVVFMLINQVHSTQLETVIIQQVFVRSMTGLMKVRREETWRKEEGAGEKQGTGEESPLVMNPHWKWVQWLRVLADYNCR